MVNAHQAKAQQAYVLRVSEPGRGEDEGRQTLEELLTSIQRTYYCNRAKIHIDNRLDGEGMLPLMKLQNASASEKDGL